MSLLADRLQWDDDRLGVDVSEFDLEFGRVH